MRRSAQLGDLRQTHKEQLNHVESLKESDTLRTFFQIYLTWMILTFIFIILGYGKYGLGAILMPMMVIPIYAGIQILLYQPFKRLYLFCRSSILNKPLRILLVILLCVVALAPIIYYGFMAYSPGCGIPEMKRMVAEGTAYFEQHREELYAEVESIPTDNNSNEKMWSADWNIKSGQTFGGLYYDSQGTLYNTSLGYPMIYPLDEYWFLQFIDGYN